MTLASTFSLGKNSSSSPSSSSPPSYSPRLADRISDLILVVDSLGSSISGLLPN